MIAPRTSGRPEGSRPAGRRLDVLWLLHEAEEPLSVAVMADRLDVHPNTVRFHLDALIHHGQVERVRPAPARPGRPPSLFRAVPGMDPAGPRHYRLLAEVLVSGLATSTDPAAQASELGRGWGRQLAAARPVSAPPATSPPAASPAAATPPTASARGAVAGRPVAVDSEWRIGPLLDLLAELDFAPGYLDGSDSRIGLRHCPFLELAETRSQVICPIHLGLMQGALEAWESPVTVGRLEAFAEPGLCLAHLAPAGQPA